MNKKNDTYFGMTWKEFKELILSRGFVIELSYNFKGDYETDEAMVCYHPKGWLLFATSFGESLNSGHIWSEVQANSPESGKEVWMAMGSGTMVRDQEYVFESEHDVRENLFAKMDELEQHGRFLNPWVSKDKFLWLVDYSEEKDDDQYNLINQRKIDQCSKELRNMIGR
jgi:hypothetical protein